ncbi:MAG: MBOAT family O-acyltransferase [Cyclobacteriaceae bacterium]|nr:MBOAT family protein [Cyclobacteriaceae bacterium]
MLFNSFEFLLFFPLVTLFYFLIPHKFRWIHLLVSSCIFYCAFIPAYIFILFATIIIDYIAGQLIEKSAGPKKKKFLIASIVANLGVLGFFKYYNFFVENINSAFGQLDIEIHNLPYLNIILPIGLSFHTFQAMSYTIEVYRGNQKAEKHFGIYSLYVMFYPQLVAGPIERPQNMIHQFREKKYFKFTEFVSGLHQMLWGLFKKIVVADQLSIYVNSIYNHWELNFGLTLIVATYAFAFQIYCDFSGYSDIAQGAARTMGFQLMDNFRLPYFSKNVTEFWRRWHISLSSWLKDYLYITLGGNRGGRKRTYFNLILTMLLGGLWHGASWNFVVWGFLNGVYLSLEKYVRELKLSLPSPAIRHLKMFGTFNLIALTWVFFRSTTFEQAAGILHNIVTANSFWNIRIQDTGIFAGMIFALTLMFTSEAIFFRKKTNPDVFTFRSMNRSVIYTTSMIVLIILFGVSDGDQFIYFQF